MFIVFSIFLSILRSFAIPLVAILILRNTFLGEQGAALAVTISLTVVTFFLVLWQVIKIIPNAIFLRGGHIIKIFLEIAIEIASVAVFWTYFLGLPPVQ